LLFIFLFQGQNFDFSVIQVRILSFESRNFGSSDQHFGFFNSKFWFLVIQVKILV